MTPIEPGQVFVCYVVIGGKLDICVSQQHVKFDPVYEGEAMFDTIWYSFKFYANSNQFIVALKVKFCDSSISISF